MMLPTLFGASRRCLYKNKGTGKKCPSLYFLSFPADCSAGMLLLVVLDEVFACHVRRLLQTHDVED